MRTSGQQKSGRADSALGFDVANADPVADQIWIGGDLDPDDLVAVQQLAELSVHGLTAIVDCRKEWNDAEWVAELAPEIDYLWIGVDDAGQRMPEEWFDQGTSFILERLADREARVLVHCHMGINRGPSLGFAALLALGWDSIEALDRIREARPIAQVAYAEDALEWWLRKTDASTDERAIQRGRLRRWRRENRLDVESVIRRIRQSENA